MYFQCTCVYMHTDNSWNMKLDLGCMFPIRRRPGSLSSPLQKKKKNSRLRENLFSFFYCSHPDCLKLSHAGKQNEELHLRWREKEDFKWIWGWMAIFALGSSLFTRCYEFCNSVSIKCHLNLKTYRPHTSHSHSTLEEVCRWVKTGEANMEARPPKLNVRHTEDGYNQGGLSLCVCEGVYIFF